MSIRGNILNNFMTDLQLVLHWPKLLPSMIIFKTMRKHHKSIRDGPVWWYLQCWWDNTRWRVKKHNATPVMQVSFTEGDLRRTVSLPVPETPHQNKSFGPTYSLRPFQEELVGVIKVHKEARGAHCKREFLHGLQWLISSFSSITELQYCRIESIVTCWKMDGAFCIKTVVSRWLSADLWVPGRMLGVSPTFPLGALGAFVGEADLLLSV